MDAIVGGVVVLTSVDPLIADVTYLSDDSRKQVLQLLSDDSGKVGDFVDGNHRSDIGAEVEHSEPGFELQGAKIVDHMEQRMFAQLGYRKKKWGMRMYEGLWVLFIGKGPLEAKIS
ncbi:hypothetical protein Tco_0841785 [Tanacetum coccineum]|uniref:Uncharacterized protein n=1 Tax=Tanacetum coccineum TaxID=301880 RepID=A0ABQ5B196_9ASTR